MERTAILKTALWSIAIILTAVILGRAFKQRNASLDSISVVGLGTKNFTSDEILFSGSYSAKALDAKEAFAIISSDQEKVKNFFISKGFKSSELILSGINFEKSYRTITIESSDNNTKTEQIFDGYVATQHISLSSRKNPDLMKRIEQVSDQTAELVNLGIEFNPSPIQYTYSDLPSLKHDLIEKASQDAKERAEKIVHTAHGSLGKLKTASMGVFQITGEGSDDEDRSGGSNDIYSKQKLARITVRLEYELD